MTPPSKKSGAGKAKTAASKPKGRAAKAASKPKPKPTSTRKTLGGPEIKLPSFGKRSGGSGLKAPAPIAGVVGDLRERGLLPVVVLLIAAIIAVPLLLSNGEDAPAVKPAAVAAQGDAVSASSSVVVSSDSGVRDYKQRLDGEARDPFDGPEAPAPATDDTGGAAATPSSSAGDEPAATGGGGTPSDGTSSPVKEADGDGIVWLSHTVDLFSGSADTKDLKLQKGVKDGDRLPNRKTPIAVFSGVPISKPDQAWFILSSSVSIVKNEGKCVLGTDQCEVVALDENQSVKLQDLSGKVWVIKVMNINQVVTRNLPK